jgi:UbiA prenyltransferase family protein
MEVRQLEMANRRGRLADLVELTKPRITFLVLITTLVGFYMGSTESLRLVVLLHTIIGTALLAGGASALNQYVERDLDARMMRTRNRPIPDGRLQPNDALLFSAIISAMGIGYLMFFVNLLTGLIGVFTLVGYIFVYTPLKTRTSLCTLIGAFPGAAPPLMGWTAARGELDAGALTLFAILFLWQMPHFFAIAWIFTDDYKRQRGQHRPADHFLLLRAYSDKRIADNAGADGYDVSYRSHSSRICLPRIRVCCSTVSVEYSRTTPPSNFRPVSACPFDAHDDRQGVTMDSSVEFERGHKARAYAL